MAKYKVDLSRTQTRYLTVEVEANSPEEAASLAYSEAGDHDFHEGVSGEAEYDVTSTPRKIS